MKRNKPKYRTSIIEMIKELLLGTIYMWLPILRMCNFKYILKIGGIEILKKGSEKK